MLYSFLGITLTKKESIREKLERTTDIPYLLKLKLVIGVMKGSLNEK